MKYIVCFTLLVCLTIYFGEIAYLQSSQLCVPALAAAAPCPLAVSPRGDPHPSLHLSTSPVSCFFWDTPTNWCPNHLFPLPSCKNSYPSKLGLQSYALPASAAPFLALSGLGCLSWAGGGGSETGWLPPDVLECGQAAGGLCFVLVLPGCTLEADAGVELLVPLLQRRVFACTDCGALFSTWHCSWNDFCAIVWESVIKKCCGWRSLFTVQ